jgi:predicted DNA binding CopG/RHH family protein
MAAKSDARLHLPEGLSPKEEAEWWDQHRDAWFSEDDEFEVVNLGPIARTAPVMLRLPVDLIEALKRAAEPTGFSYQWLIKTWLEERLQAEPEARGALPASPAPAARAGHAKS